MNLSGIVASVIATLEGIYSRAQRLSVRERKDPSTIDDFSGSPDAVTEGEIEVQDRIVSDLIRQEFGERNFFLAYYPRGERFRFMHYTQLCDALRKRIAVLNTLKATLLQREEQGLVDQASPFMVSSNKRVFIVHGHDEVAKLQLKNFLQKLGLEPIILHECDSIGMTIVEKFEYYARTCTFAFVLLTPDDPVQSDDPEIKRRARQNVILEMGWFFRHVGRQNVLLLNKGVELPTDILGVIYLPFRDRVEEVGEEIRQRLQGAGLLRAE